MEQFEINDTIAAVSTPAGVGGIAVIRVSGPKAIQTVNEAWNGARLTEVKSHTAHLGEYRAKDGEILDQCVATVFKGPNSFTGQDVVEISVHGSGWIQRELLNDLVKRGVRIANPGEFTQRAFANGKFDLTQAEGVADLIASSSRAAHSLALSQTKGSFSKEFLQLRNNLIEFASLLELELDFSEEEVEFAERKALIELCERIIGKIDRLAGSYSNGAALKNGVPVVIAGIPNAGKSSLLNLLLGEDKAIVTDIPGTTRDIIEDAVEINGVLYRFMDTAGLRSTHDLVEGIGVDRAQAAIRKAHIVIWVIDSTAPIEPQLTNIGKESQEISQNTIVLLNKADVTGNVEEILSPEKYNPATILFSTKTRRGEKELLERLHHLATKGQNPESDIIITNARHFEALTRASESLKRALEGLQNGLSGDFIAQDIREATAHLSALTGDITTTHLFHSIFSRFCIGK